MSSPLISKKPIDDNQFDAKTWVQKEDHDREMGEIGSRLKKIEDKFGDNDKIAETLKQTSKKSAVMQKVLISNFVNCIKTHEPTREAIKNLINSEDRKYFFSSWKRMWKIIGTLALAAATGAIGYLLKGHIV